MSLRQFLLALRSRVGLALAVFLVVVAAAFAATLALPQRYTATAAVLVDVRSADPVSDRLAQLMALPGYMATQRDIITSERVALRVVKLLGLDALPQNRARWLQATRGDGSFDAWLAEQLQAGLQVKPSLESNVLKITYRSSQPAFAAAAANAFAKAYIESSIELRVDPAKGFARFFDEQDDAARRTLQQAEARLIAHRQKHGLAASDEQFDSETRKLNDLTAQLTVVQGQAAEAESKRRSARAASSLPEVVQNPLIAMLKRDVARQEASLGELAGGLGVNHPQYRQQQTELNALKQRLDHETRVIVSGFAAGAAVSKKREADLAAAIAAQKQKVLALRQARDELAALQREVDVAHRAYETVAQRHMQSRLESQFAQTNVSLLNAAAQPASPSFPKLPIMLALAVVLGAFCGVAAAFLREMHDRRIRCADDVVEMLQIPLLGAIPRPGEPARLALPWKRLPALPAPLQGAR
jgi:chain length determinant protein EpsF